MTKNTKNARKTRAAKTVADSVETVANHAVITVETVAKEETRDERAEFNAAVAEYAAELAFSFDKRMHFESLKSADNLSIQSKLKDMRASVAHTTIAALFYVASVDANFINRAERATHRFNVYSAQKVINIARYIASVATLNHYTLAIVKSALLLEANELLLTNKDADSACSLAVKTDAQRQRFIVQYQSHVDAKTAATQASSSVNALQTMNVFSVTRDAANRECFKLNRDNVVTQKLLEMIAS